MSLLRDACILLEEPMGTGKDGLKFPRMLWFDHACMLLASFDVGHDELKVPFPDMTISRTVEV